MTKIISLLLLVTILSANTTPICLDDFGNEIPTPDCILKKYNLNENIKSNKGWLRLLNSESKMVKYGITLSSLEHGILKKYFKSKSSKARRILR